MSIYFPSGPYSWHRDRICGVCKQPFRTMGGNVVDCAVCRNTEEAKAARLERKRRIKNRYERRKRRQISLDRRLIA